MEGFFLFACGSDSEDEIIDRFAARYGWTVSEILDLDLVRRSGLYTTIRSETRKREAREQWLSMLPMMASKVLKFMSFEEYYDQVSGRNIDLRPDEEILAEVEAIRKEMKER